MIGKKKRGLIRAILLAIVAGIVLGTGWVMARGYETQKAYTPTNLIRLHIIGNSDSDKDQEVKLKVRDSVMNTFSKYLMHAQNRIQAEEIIAELLPQIEQVAKSRLLEAGVQYDPKAKIDTIIFPDKIYEDEKGKTFFLPEGPYKSLQIVLGKGNGENWWCVMYPPMCFIDIVKKTEVSSKSKAVLNISPDDHQCVLLDETVLNEADIEYKFLFLEILKKGKTFVSSILSKKFNLPNLSP